MRYHRFYYQQASSWLGDAKSKDAADAQGNYFVKRGNLRLISLNTNMCCERRSMCFAGPHCWLTLLYRH